jgi:hypothetical protein
MSAAMSFVLHRVGHLEARVVVDEHEKVLEATTVGCLRLANAIRYRARLVAELGHTVVALELRLKLGILISGEPGGVENATLQAV